MKIFRKENEIDGNESLRNSRKYFSHQVSFLDNAHWASPSEHQLENPCNSTRTALRLLGGHFMQPT